MSQPSLPPLVQPTWRNSLATRLTWVSMVIVTVALAAVGAGLTLIAGQAQRQGAFVLQQQRAAQSAQLISGHVALARDRLNFFLQTEDLFLMPTALRRERMENLLLASQPRYSLISLLDGSGRELVKVSRFHTYLAGELTNRAGEEFFRAAIKGEIYLGPVEVAPDSGLLTLLIALPVENRARQTRGVLVAEVNVSLLWREVAQLDVGRDGYAFLVDRQGKFLAFHKPATVLQRYGEDMIRLPPVAGFVQGRGEISAAGSEYQGMQSERVVGALAPIQETQWAVVVEWPTREAYAGLRLMLIYLVVLALVAIVLAGGTGFFVSRRLVRPVRALTEAARQIGAGNMDAPVPRAPGNDEVGLLSASFDGMRGELKRLYASLGDKVSELERTQEALRQSEAHYRSIFDNSILGIFQTTPQGRVLGVNAAYGKMLGFASPKLVMESVSDLGEQVYESADDRRRFRAMLERDGRVEDFVCRLKRADGEIIWVSQDARAVLDSGGKIAYFEGMVQDITARKEAEKELAKRTEELDRYFTSSLDLLAIADTDGFFRRLNPQWERTLGYSLDELEGRRFLDLVHPDDLEATLAAMANLMDGKEVTMFQNRYRHRDGSYRWIEWRSYPAGKTIYAAARDVTERMRAEDGLRKNEERLRAILEASPHPVVVYELSGAATFINPAFSRVFGWRADEVLGRRIPFVPEEYRAQAMGWIEKLYKDGRTVSFETKRLTKTGQTLDIFNSAAGILDAQGTVVGMVVNLTDLTPYKRLESQLRQAQKMEAIGTLAGGIAHDFNNVLQAISGYTQLILAEARVDDRDRERLEHMGQYVARASGMIGQLMTMARKGQTRLEWVDLNRDVARTVRMLELTLPRMIRMSIDAAPDLKPIRADATQIEQVLLNLSANAAQAMPQGGELAFATRNLSWDDQEELLQAGLEPGDYVRLQVSDTGVGMDEETCSHIFEPFFTTKPHGKGTGLGLSTVYGIVTNFGGSILCRSQPGRGATFTIYMPAGKGLASDAPSPPTLSIMAAAGHETILVVDDEAAILDSCRQALEMLGYAVLTAGSGEEALKTYLKSPREISLVILDLNMPGMGGRECLLRLRKADPQVRVLVASGYADDTVKEEIGAAGAVSIIGKPYKFSDLMTAVRGLLDGK